MKYLNRKLKSKRGESLVEILISILVVAFGCMLIATMYTAAMNMNVQASKNDDNYYKAVSEMEQMFDNAEGYDSKGKAVITGEDENGFEKNLDVSVKIYGDGSNAAYKR